jgi:hypothetical protein
MTLSVTAPHPIMIIQYNRKSLAFGIPGILLQQGWLVLIVYLGLKNGSHGHPLPGWAGTLFGFSFVVGTILWLVGCCYYAKAKGYDAFVGFVGIFAWAGLLILFALPDNIKSQDQELANTPPEPN